MFTSIDGVTLHYTVEGSQTGTPLVLINSLGSSLHIWDLVAPRLATRAPIIRDDKRGHGLSDCPPGPYTLANHANDLAGLLDYWQVPEAILIGISVGGMIALTYALAQPTRVKALVLCDTGAQIGTPELWNSRIEAIRQQGMAAMTASILARWFTPAFAQQQPAMYQGYANMLMRTPVEGYIATCAALREADLRTAVSAIQTPTLVLCGTEDLSTPPALGQALAAQLKNARFALIDSAAHLPCIEQPTTFVDQVEHFLQESELSAENRYARGMKIRRSVLGDAHVDRATANQTAFDADFQRFITETAWGTVWARPGLERKTRHMLTLAILAALGKEHELTLHLRATRNTGLTPDQVKEIFIHLAIYAGVPAANTAFATAKRIYAESTD